MIEFSEVFDDNVYVTPSGEVHDFITYIEPSVAVRSNFPRHELNFRASAKIGRYASETGENFEDYDVGFDGRIDAIRDANIFGGLVYAIRHEGRGSPDDVAGVEPTEYTRITGNAGYFRRLGRFNATFEGEFVRLDFDDVALPGGAIINNDDRDRTEYVASLHLAYEILPEYEAFVNASYNWRQYDDGADDSGFDRDSHGYEITAGATIDLTGLIEGDVFIGYLEQNYDDPLLSTESGVTGGVGLTWNVTPLTTITGSLSVSVVETTSVGASGYLATVGGLNVDHELLRNLIIGAEVSYTNNDYEGISRNDNLFTAGLNADYFINRYLFAGASYDFKNRNSDISGVDYEQNIAMIRIGLQR